MNISFEALKVKAQLENLARAPTLENANVLLRQIQLIRNENFQIVQDVFITTLLTLMDGASGMNKNEVKTTLIQCIIVILNGSRIKKELPYRAILKIILKQIFDFPSNAYIASLSEELKIAILDCIEVASRQLDYDAVEQFMVDDNKILLSQCIFVCKEAIAKEKYSKIRKSAIEALIALLQIHDKSDFSDIVLRDQISKIVFLVLPQISVVLIKACEEETIKGSSLVQTAAKAFGRFLCLVFEDYERKATRSITTSDFMSLVKASNDVDESVLHPRNQSQAEHLMNLKRSQQWLCEASKKLASAIVRLASLRGSEHSRVRNELAVLSWNLLQKCLPNIRSFAPFLLENLVMLADDCDGKIRAFSQESLRKLSETVPELNQEIAELFSTHLTVMPRVILTGDESEQIAGFTLLNSFIISDNSHLLDNSLILEKFLNVMLSCCEIEVQNDLMLYENLAASTLDDHFYHMKKPWKQFKNLKSESIVQKFTEICHNIGASKASQMCVNYLLDNMNSIEFLVLLIEILSCQNLTLAQDQVEGIVEEFLNDTYWSMKIQAASRIEKKQRPVNEEWFHDTTLGLYESAIEIRLRDVSLEEDGDKAHAMNMKAIKYNILCTCLVVELVGTASRILGKKFQRFMLQSLHRVLEKAGSSNFIIRTAGIQTLEAITAAMGFSEVSQLIDGNSDYLLFNIQKDLKRNQASDSVLDMLSVVFKFSKTSMTSYIKDIVETVTEQMSNKFMRNASGYLKLFRLYASSIKQWEKRTDEATAEVTEVTSGWEDFLEQCLFELKKLPDDVNESCPLNEISDDSDEPPTGGPNEGPEEPQNDDTLPEYIELLLKILTSSLQFFASMDPSEVILTHDIFIDSFSVLCHYEDQFLPMIHLMWYPFTKQFQVKNLVVLQNSFRLVAFIARHAKDFVLKRSTNDVIPALNKFLLQSFKTKTVSLSYTQEFKLQREILNGYGSLAVDLEVDDKGANQIIDILLKYHKNPNETLAAASANSLKILRNHNPGLICFKMKFSE